jgi:hypothetical protein
MMLRRLLPLFALSVALSSAQAARPLITDDARVTDPQACQMESWVHLHRDRNELWALPACNPSGNLEFTLGGALSRSNGQADSGAVLIQGKTLFKTLETNSYGIGLAAGYATQPGKGQSGSPYFYVPVSFSFADDRFVLHTNLGATRLRENKETRLTWGLGSETQTSERLYIIAETYGQDKGSPFFQMGLRYWIVTNHVQIDTTYGSQIGHLHDERWVSIGLRLITPPLF